MSIKTLWHESWGKAVIALISGMLLGVMYFIAGLSASWYSSIVFADELDALAEIIGAQVAAEVAPIAAQSKMNADELCRVNLAILRASRRDLMDEINAMQSADSLTDRETRYLAEWKVALEETEEQIDALNNCAPRQVSQ